MAKNDLSDDYVANLLKADAKSSTQRYAQIGFGALLPKRSTTNAPKPNVRFLRNILRETDSHNAALLAKEAEDSRERLRNLRKEEQRGSRREYAESSKRRKREHNHDDGRHMKRRREEGHEKDRDRRERRDKDGDKSLSRRHRSHSRERSEKCRRHHHRGSASPIDHERRSHRSKSTRNGDSRGKRDDDERRSARRSHRSRSPKRSKERSSQEQRSSRRHRSSSAESSSRNPIPGNALKSSKESNHKRVSSHSLAREDDSDPLEAIVGPLPPKPGSPIRRRGRGAFTAAGTSADAHFATDYDPSVDVRPQSDEEDDWEQTLEVMRDRQRWKQQGADRLRQAGFTEEQVHKWEKGDEKTEEDVKWTKKGEGREWDRGKVVDDSGDITLQPEWGRLKDT
jgi:hypothetical protein